MCACSEALGSIGSQTAERLSVDPEGIALRGV